MSRLRMALILALAASAAGGGCGRPTLPGQQFTRDLADTRPTQRPDSPLPPEPVLEFGPPEARVRVVAFFPIDEERKPLIEVMKGLADEHRGRVFVRYVDYRTPEGFQIWQRAGMQSEGVLINGERSVEIEADPQPYRVEFVQPMGRWWTETDLRRAVAQEVARLY